MTKKKKLGLVGTLITGAVIALSGCASQFTPAEIQAHKTELRKVFEGNMNEYNIQINDLEKEKQEIIIERDAYERKVLNKFPEFGNTQLDNSANYKQPEKKDSSFKEAYKAKK